MPRRPAITEQKGRSERESAGGLGSVKLLLQRGGLAFQLVEPALEFLVAGLDAFELPTEPIGLRLHVGELALGLGLVRPGGAELGLDAGQLRIAVTAFCVIAKRLVCRRVLFRSHGRLRDRQKTGLHWIG